MAIWAAAAVLAVVDGEAGVGAWLDLRERAQQSRARVAGLEREVERLSAEVEALHNDPLAVERAIREDLELARPGESVVRFAASRSGARTGAPGAVPLSATSRIR